MGNDRSIIRKIRENRAIAASKSNKYKISEIFNQFIETDKIKDFRQTLGNFRVCSEIG